MFKFCLDKQQVGSKLNLRPDDLHVSSLSRAIDQQHETYRVNQPSSVVRLICYTSLLMLQNYRSVWNADGSAYQGFFIIQGNFFGNYSQSSSCVLYSKFMLTLILLSTSLTAMCQSRQLFQQHVSQQSCETSCNNNYLA